MHFSHQRSIVVAMERLFARSARSRQIRVPHGYPLFQLIVKRSMARFARHFASLVAFSVAALVGTTAGAQTAVDAVAEAPVPPTPAAADSAVLTPGAPGSAEAIADRVQAFYDQAKTYKAKFKQRFTIYAYNRTKDSSGEVVFSKPGKMRWTYTNNGNVVVSDNRHIKIYEKREQADVPANGRQRRNTPPRCRSCWVTAACAKSSC